MSRQIGDVVREMRRILIKSAEEQLSDSNVLDGNRHATDGAGDKVPEEKKKGDVDQMHPQIEQTDDGSTSVDNQIALGGGSETAVKDEGMSSKAPTKMAQLANQILSEMQGALGDSKSRAFKEGEKTAEAHLKNLLKIAMEEEDSEEEEPVEEEEEEEEPEDIDLEKMSADQKYQYEMYKQAGAQACMELFEELAAQNPSYVQGMQTGQELTKQASYQAGVDFAKLLTQSKQAGYEAAKQEIFQALEQEKRANLQLRQQKSLMHETVKQALNELVKESEDQLRAEKTQRALSVLEQIADGGTPRPFACKAAADIAQVHPVLTGLLNDGTITDEEKQAIIEYLAAAETLDERSISNSVEGVSNAPIVQERIMRNVLQQNDSPVLAPEPAMPVSQESPSAEYTGVVSSDTLPTSTDAQENAKIASVVRSVLNELRGR
jgi:hypothetical protein